MLAIFHMMHYFKKAVRYGAKSCTKKVFFIFWSFQITLRAPPDRVWIFNFCPIDDFLIVSPSLSLDQPAQQDTRLPYLG